MIDAATSAHCPAPSAVQAAESLTEREREVAVLVDGGLTNAEIASRMHLSLATVKAHLTRTFEKLGTDNRASAAMAIRDAGLLHG